MDLFFQLTYIPFTWYSDPEGHTFPLDEAAKKSLALRFIATSEQATTRMTVTAEA